MPNCLLRTIRSKNYLREEPVVNLPHIVKKEFQEEEISEWCERGVWSLKHSVKKKQHAMFSDMAEKNNNTSSNAKQGKIISTPAYLEKKGSMHPEIFRHASEKTSGLHERSAISKGSAIFARWKDGTYYSGMVKSKGAKGRWIICFSDGETQNIGEKYLILDRWLPRNFEVLLSKNSTDYFPAVILNLKEDENDSSKLLFGVTRKNSMEPIYVPHTSIALNEKQAEKLRKLRRASRSGQTPHAENIGNEYLKDKDKNIQHTEKYCGTEDLLDKTSLGLKRSKPDDFTTDDVNIKVKKQKIKHVTNIENAKLTVQKDYMSNVTTVKQKTTSLKESTEESTMKITGKQPAEIAKTGVVTPRVKDCSMCFTSVKKSSTHHKIHKESYSVTVASSTEKHSTDVLKREDAVFAKWKDGIYYSGIVKEKKPDGKWLVSFSDGAESCVSEINIMASRELPKNMSVMLNEEDDDEYTSGIIVSCKRDPTNASVLLYKIKYEDCKEYACVPCTNIALRERQVQQLKKLCITDASDNKSLKIKNTKESNDTDKKPSPKYEEYCFLAPKEKKFEKKCLKNQIKCEEKTVDTPSICMPGFDKQRKRSDSIVSTSDDSVFQLPFSLLHSSPQNTGGTSSCGSSTMPSLKRKTKSNFLLQGKKVYRKKLKFEIEQISEEFSKSEVMQSVNLIPRRSIVPLMQNNVSSEMINERHIPRVSEFVPGPSSSAYMGKADTYSESSKISASSSDTTSSDYLHTPRCNVNGTEGDYARLHPWYYNQLRTPHTATVAPDGPYTNPVLKQCRSPSWYERNLSIVQEMLNNYNLLDQARKEKGELELKVLEKKQLIKKLERRAKKLAKKREKLNMELQANRSLDFSNKKWPVG